MLELHDGVVVDALTALLGVVVVVVVVVEDVDQPFHWDGRAVAEPARAAAMITVFILTFVVSCERMTRVSKRKERVTEVNAWEREKKTGRSAGGKLYV